MIVWAVLLFAASVRAETYIVPMYGVAGGSWYPLLTVTNPHETPVTLRIVRGYPMISGRCANCIEHPPLTIGGRSSVNLLPFWSDTKEFVIAGAYELETSAPVRVDAMYFGHESSEIRQRLEIGRSWLPAGEHLATVQAGGSYVRLNAVVVNPNAFDISVSVWRGQRGENEVRIPVPAGATRMVPLPALTCGGEPCGPYPDIVAPPELVHFESPAPFLAGVSSIAPSWALFSLAGDGG